MLRKENIVSLVLKKFFKVRSTSPSLQCY